MALRLFVLIPLLLACAAARAAPAAEDIIRRAIDHYRGQTSYTEMTMTIHREDWERSMSMRAWTEGDERTLVRVTAPRKDAGNGTLSVDGNMWTYSPRINRVIKIPSSMMNQNWMGSDFSNKDISKDADIVDQYDHTLLDTREEGGHTVYVIQSVPHEEAAVVWGREVLTVRDDWVLLEQQFRDQDDVLVKTLRALEIAEMSGRTVATVMRMASEETPGEWTELRTGSIEFGVEIQSGLFTLSNLRNPRQ
ncbi:outer membrane lipoprotein-sorting protein [Parahaliea mediterranea]|uniref:Outer membrane lipoprotein-sorting protein n=1 Tax=Parahaliea mediterranea TaxID=651086 RepID=A0A939IM46_9GAMM|nr:outer membrane lipoprotein-sorting protein [Parahaliea mediterranea]MBN7796653.1 outer membrane lipoprotein-sorting protein [Parahaliea mediterranea]